MVKKKNIRVHVIHGPNLNMLGKREPAIYGIKALEEIDADLKNRANSLGISLETFQSNHEGEIIEKIHDIFNTKSNGLIINPAAFTHTSIAIRDALTLLDIPIIEVHLSNIYKREEFRHKSMLADIVTGQITGLGSLGYTLALNAIAEDINGK
ncbi:MAG: type II 3-dehydroquinate dehydratase [Desulfobacteraceae bacterium]|nr:type II 3-dehydroquinate dehydratase [Desulfobacteraceae bacterium]